MSNLAQRPPLGQKSPKPDRGTSAGKAHMARVAGLGCILCGYSAASVHHCISGRYGSRKASDFDTIPLCHLHHQGADGIHTDKARWEAMWGPDTDYLPIVARLLNDRPL